MKSPERVAWTDGMPVGPHHLQQLDLYHEQLLDRRLSALGPHAWGVVSAEFDGRALASGQVRLQRFSGVLPDGIYLELDDGDAATPAARPIDKHFSPTQPALEVFLGVIREREGVANLPEREGSSRPTRFSVATRQVPDASSGANEQPIAFAQQNVTLLFGDEARQDYEAVKIAEVVRNAQGAFVLSDSYIPPALRLSASPPLVERLKALLALAHAKQRTLLVGRRQRDGASVEFSAADVTPYLLLSAVSQFIPLLHHVIESADLPPRSVYLLLAQFTGALLPFSSESEATALPPFSHTDLRASFDGVLSRLMAQIGATIKENFIAVPLKLGDGGYFGLLDDDRVLRARDFVLAVRSQLPESQTAQILPGLCKIASWTDISPIVHASAPGVPLTATSRPPPEIPIRAGHVYFTLGASDSDRVWRNIVHERRLAVYLPSPFSANETQLQLLCVPQPAPAAGR